MRSVAVFTAIGLILGCFIASASAESALTDSLQIGAGASKIEKPASAFKSSLRFETAQPNSGDTRAVKVEGPSFKSSIKIEGASK
ncbi:MAG TPA: hypothetical protein VKT73_10540 [Xanthobacteraceae bacterium]|nr:hypothetical protein [Xanthobacteraceae bacterium]